MEAPEDGDNRLRFVCRCGQAYLDLGDFLDHAEPCNHTRHRGSIERRNLGYTFRQGALAGRTYGWGRWPNHYLSRMLGMLPPDYPRERMG